MLEKKKEEIKQIVDEKTKEVGEKAMVITVGLVAGASLTIGYIVGALSSAILLQVINKA